MKIKYLCGTVLAALLIVQTPAVSAAKRPSKEQAQEVEKEQAASSAPSPETASAPESEEDALLKVSIKGPATVELGNQATLKLPEGMGFIPKDEANALMQEAGNGTNPNRYGMVFPMGQDQNERGWLVDLTYTDSGYIKDDDAKNWDTEGMLQSLKDGAEEQNKERKSRGLPELETHGWVEKPQYDPATHSLIWSIDVYHKNEAGQNPSINYNTFRLGREGYIEMTMATDLNSIDKYKPVAREILGNIEFKEGKRYSDFNPSTDKVAEYGLAALVGGIAAKKLGLLALLGALLAKFGKLVFVGVIAVAALIRGLWRRKGGRQDEE
ncbi:MAG: DUF2167 domain-containing protein [Neisseria sp.]|nr:DUF2167 domain-containing protein [Neisseria sp.]